MLYHSCSNLPINKMVGLNNTTVRAESSTFFIYLFILIEGYFFNYRILIKKSFREFCCFLSNLNMNQPPFWTSLPGPFPSHLSRLMQSPCLSFPGHTTSSRWLSSLHMVMQVSMLLSIHLILSSPLPMSISLFSMSVSPLPPCINSSL